MAAGKCKAAYHKNEYHGFECSITESPYKFPHQDNKFYPEQYEEGPDAVEIDFEEINLEEIEESLNELEQYKKLGTLEEVRGAVEKNRAKKPIYKHYENVGEPEYINVTCPNGCGIQLNPVTDKHHVYEHDYCPKCGQKIDWSEKE